MKKLEAKSMYQQAKDAILQYIEDNRSQGNQLPSEMDFAKMMGVSRNTVREALKILENEGIVYSRHGVGTFIVPAGQRVTASISSLKSLTKIIRDHGYTPGTTNMGVSVVEANARIAERLTVKPGSKLLYIERVRTADKVPVAYVKDYIVHSDSLERAFTSYQTESLLLFLEEQLSIKITHSVCNIRAVTSNKYTEQLLRLSGNTALLLLEQTHYEMKGAPCFYSESYFVDGKFNFNIIRKIL